LALVVISAILVILPATAKNVNAASSRSHTAPGHGEASSSNFGQCTNIVKDLGTLDKDQAKDYCKSFYGQGIP
jgi:hypothetical protein